MISRICENHADVFLNQNTLPGILRATLQSVADKPRISCHCCQSIKKLAESAKCLHSQQNALSQYFSEMVKILLVNSNRDDGSHAGVNVHQASFEALIALVENSGAISADTVYILMIDVLKTLDLTVSTEMGHDKAQIL